MEEKRYSLSTVLRFAEEFMGVDMTDADGINKIDTEDILDNIEKENKA